MPVFAQHEPRPFFRRALCPWREKRTVVGAVDTVGGEAGELLEFGI